MPVWTSARLDEAVKLWQEGYTQQELARHFHVTRSSAGGVISRHRELFPPRIPGQRPHRSGPRPAKPKLPSRRVPSWAIKPKPRPVPPPPPPNPVHKTAGDGAFTIARPHAVPPSKEALRRQLEQALINTAKLKTPKWAVIR